jgi:hypothetical protein
VRLIVSGDGVPFVVSLIDPLMAVVDVGVKIALKVRLPPAAMVVAVVNPETVIPVPVVVIFEKESVAFPLFVSVMGLELLDPTAIVPNATLVGDAAIWGCTPVPVSPMLTGDPGALLVMEIVPGELPAVVGVKVAVMTIFAPALIVFGAVRFIVYPAPVILAAVMFSVAVPVLVSVTF